jgi:hypothetical protein
MQTELRQIIVAEFFRAKSRFFTFHFINVLGIQSLPGLGCVLQPARALC